MAVTALLFFAALLLAEAAVRVVRAPRIAALVLAGALLGALRQSNTAAAMMPLPSLLLQALAMVLLFEVGQRVPLGWLRRNPWLLAASVGECAIAFAAIYAVLAFGFGEPPVDCALIAGICMAASPIVVMSVSKDLRARGQVSERALLFSTLAGSRSASVNAPHASNSFPSCSRSCSSPARFFSARLRQRHCAFMPW